MIILRGNPVSTQTIYRFSCIGNYPRMYMTKRGKSTKEDYQWSAKSQWKEDPIKKDLEVVVRFYFKDRATRDLDNHNKLWQDALTGIVYYDDKQIRKMTTERLYDKIDPRIEIDVIQ